MSESTPDMPDLEVPDVDLPDVDTPGIDHGTGADPAADLVDMPDGWDDMSTDQRVDWLRDNGYGDVYVDDDGNPISYEEWERLNEDDVNTGTPMDAVSDGSYEAWYQQQVASYGQPRGAGAGTGRSRRRGLFGARTTNGAGGGGGFRLGSLLNVNVRFGGGARTTNVTGLSIGGARPGVGARIASRRGK